MSERRGVKGLELWCKKVTSGYPGVKVENMTTSWRNGLAFCAIIHRFRPDLIDFFKLNKDDIYENNELAFRTAEHHLGIPALLEPIDMVQYEVPDRLSILTYLSQFYQAFAVREGSNSITGKRLQPPPDHESSTASSSPPPSKVASLGIGHARRQPCAKCNQHVYIAERLSVGKSLFHRPCFRCARCGAQLAPASYYETENGEYCCEVCPDEEKPDCPIEGQPAALSIVNSGQPDDYSTVFEAALESVSSSSSPGLVAKRADLEKFLGYKDQTRDFPTDSRSSDNNVNLSLDNNLESIDNVTKEEKQLSVRVRMKLFENNSDDPGVSNKVIDKSRPFSYIKGSKSKNILTNNENSDRLNEGTQEISDSASSNDPSKNIPKSSEITPLNEADSDTTSIEHTKHSLKSTQQEFKSSTEPSDVIITEISEQEFESSTQPSEIIITEISEHEFESSTEPSEVVITEITPAKEAETVENTTEEVSTCAGENVDDVIVIDSSPEEKHVQKFSLEVKNEDIIEIDDSLNTNSNDGIIVIESSPEDYNYINETSPESIITDSNGTDKDVLVSTAGSTDIIVPKSSLEETSSRSIIEESPRESVNCEGSTNVVGETKEEIVQGEFPSITYPVDLNPFGDDEESEYKPIPPTRKKQSITPLPAERKGDGFRRKISVASQYKTAIGDDLNPFSEDDDEEESSSQSLYVSTTSIPSPQPRRRKISLPPECKKQMGTMPVNRISINPQDGTEVVIRRNMENYDDCLNPFADFNESEESSSLNQSDLSTIAHSQDSKHQNNSLSIDTRLMFGSTSSISSGSIHGSARKKKPAPRPPVLSATFNGDSVVSSPSQSNVSSPSAVRKHRKGRKAPPPPMVTSTPAVKTVVEMNGEIDIKENEQQEPIHRNSQAGLSRFSHLNKSTHGRWKQKKCPAPALPIPQKRTIKSLPMKDIRRELDLIEIQQQGLEKQSVKIEQLIREKEEDESETGEDLPIEVEDLLLQLFEIVNEKNELLRKQTELMYLKKEQRLEEEHAEIEYQIRCLMAKPEDQKTASDKAKEDELITLLVDIVERRNEIIKCLDMDRVKEADEDSYISSYVNSYTANRDLESLEVEEKKPEHKGSKDTLSKKIKRKFKKKSKTEPEKDKTTKN